ncbi:MAG: thioredoxin [Bdellovibrionota bacterium]
MDNEYVFTLTDQNFQTSVLDAKEPVLVDLWAAWCGPCRALAPTIDELATEYAGKVKVAKLDIDANPAIPAQFGVKGIPTVLIFKNGLLVDKFVGMQPKEKYTEALKKHSA